MINIMRFGEMLKIIMKLKKALSLFLAAYQHSPATHRAYAAVLTRLINAIGAERKLKRIRTIDLADYLADLRKRPEKYANHPTRPIVKAGLSEATLNKEIKTYKRFFNWCVENHYLKRSPATALHQKMLPHYISRDKAMRAEELEKLLPYARRNPRDYALVMFVADSGCRAGGAATLTLDRLDLQSRQALVTEKGGTSYFVKFGELTALVLAEWLTVYRPDVDHHSVFTGKYAPYDPVSPDAASQMIRRACKKLDLRSLGAHSLRHRMGHRLAGAGVAITSAGDILGHKSLRSTEGYFQQRWSEIKKIGLELAIPRRERKILPFKTPEK